MAAAPAAHALERVTLSSGFSYDCARHQAIEGGRVRLFLHGSGEGNYVDMPASQITAVEDLPEPPPRASAAAGHTPAGAEVRDLLTHAGAAHNIDVELLASVVQAESGGATRAVSRAGAQGLMQLMPQTAQQLGVHDAFAPAENIGGGTAYLDQLLTRYHENLPLALAAYNAGPAAVDRFHGIPPFRETQAYVVRVLREFKRRKQAATLRASR